MALEFGAIFRRDEFRNQKIFKFASRVILTQQDRFGPQVRPIDGLAGGQSMVFRQCDHSTLAPERHGLAVKERRLSCNDRDVYRAVPQRGDETRPRTFDHAEVYLRESLRIFHQRCAQISSR